MSWVDIVIVVVVLVATERGYALGILRQVGSLVGFISGFVLGVWLARPVALHFNSEPTRPLAAALVVGVCVLVCAVLGRKVGAMANNAVRRLNLGTVDRASGAIFAAAGALLMCWLVASLLVNVSLGSLSSAIANSKILTAVDSVMPPVPSVEARVQALFDRENFPSVFADVVQPLAPSASLPTLATAEAAADGRTPDIFKVLTISPCGPEREGTAFLIGPDELATAAHVVAGAHAVFIGSIKHANVARVVWFDPDNDVAILRANVKGTAVPLDASTPARGTGAAVVGFPLNSVSAVLDRAAVDGTLVAQGRDIYDNTLVTRTLVVALAAVQPGNSGSPLLAHGRAVGLVFSRSVAQSGVAYAVPASVVAADQARAATGKTVSTGACLPAE